LFAAVLVGCADRSATTASTLRISDQTIALQTPVVIMTMVVSPESIQVEIEDFVGDREFSIRSLRCQTDSDTWDVLLPLSQNSDGSSSQRVDLAYIDVPRMECLAASNTGPRSFSVGLPISAKEIATSTEPCGPFEPVSDPVVGDGYYCFGSDYPQLVVSDGFVVGASVHVDQAG
jgi:hypothetical protein